MLGLVLCSVLLQAPLQIDSTSIDLLDEARSRTIPIRVTYPVREGKVPLIILSHGFRGSKDGMQPLVTTWATHGYVVIQPTHEDSARNLTLRQKASLFVPDFSSWQSRVEDVKFILNNLPKVESMIPSVKDKIDATRIGVGGHSFGAHTTMLIGDVRMRGRSWADPRPIALLLLSPQGNAAGLTKDSWKTMTRPTLVVTGSNDNTPPLLAQRDPENAESRQMPYRLSPPGNKFLLFLQGVNHDLGGINSLGLRQPPPQLVAVEQATTAFWDRTLKGTKTPWPTLPKTVGTLTSR